MEKKLQIPGKGQNELLEIAFPLMPTRVATKAVQRHVSENRGTEVKHMQHVILASVRQLAEKAAPQQIRHKNQHPHKFSHSCIAGGH
jgi:primosomal protein N''